MSCSSFDSTSSEDSGITTISTSSHQSHYQDPKEPETDDEIITITPSETDSLDQRCCDFSDQDESAVCSFLCQDRNAEMIDLWTVFNEAQLADERVLVTLQNWCVLIQLKIRYLEEIIQQEKLDLRRSIDDEIDIVVDNGLVTIDDVIVVER